MFLLGWLFVIIKVCYYFFFYFLDKYTLFFSFVLGVIYIFPLFFFINWRTIYICDVFVDDEQFEFTGELFTFLTFIFTGELFLKRFHTLFFLLGVIWVNVVSPWYQLHVQSCVTTPDGWLQNTLPAIDSFYAIPLSVLLFIDVHPFC